MSDRMLSLKRDSLLNLLTDLVSVPSVSCSGHENRLAELIMEKFSGEAYFRENPSHLRLLPLEGDPLERHGAAAFYRAGPEVRETIIITGHYDVVDAEAYGPLKELAFSPRELTARAGELDLTDEARADLESGEYLFGRGVSDMKGGIALMMAFLAETARAGDFPVNLLFLGVPDEENTSAGMRGCLPWLIRLREEWGIDYAAAVSAEPSMGTPERSGGMVFLGAIGKMMPFFLCVGNEAHVCDYYDGLNTSLILANLALILEGAAGTSEEHAGVNLPPMACLRFRDLVKNYSVTLPERAISYYNLLTVKKTPAMVLKEMKAAAGKALEDAIGRIAHQRRVLAERVGERLDFTPPVGRVMEFSELVQRAREKTSGFDAAVKSFMESLPGDLDKRERGVELVYHLLDLAGEKGPLIVTGFLPPYYPPRLNLGETSGEKAILRAVERLKAEGERSGLHISTTEVFSGIIDLSYFGFQGDGADLDLLAENTPLWGSEYRFPLEELKCLDIPAVNFGPIGKDDHKAGERIHLPFYLDSLPGLFSSFVRFVAEESAMSER
ncbi:MAG: M20/M25/M40 family metallo-hydrolase [Aminivibrio sp.]